MARVFRLAATAAVPTAATFLLLCLAPAGRAQNKKQLSGHWSFNSDQSDDADQKVQAAQQSSKTRASTMDDGTYPTPGGTYPAGGGGMGGMGRVGVGGIGGMGGMGGPMGRPSHQQNRAEAVSSEEWDRLAENPKYLRINQRSDQVVMTDDQNRAVTYYPDGKKHEDKNEDGRKISTKASWEGDSLIAENKLPHGEKMTRTFRVSDDGKQLTIVTRFDAPTLNAPLSIRRVYDLEKPDSR